MDDLKGKIVKWSRPPFGYKFDSTNKGHLIPDEEAAKIVREIFKKAVGGMSYTAIAEELNRDGVPSPGKYKALQNPEQNTFPEKTADEKWNFVTVRRVVLNPVYIGRSCKVPDTLAEIVSAEKLPITHEPLVTDAQFEAVSSIGGKWYHDDSLFDGIVCCSACGGPLGLVGEREDPNLVCKRARSRGRGKCKAPAFIRYSDLKQLVVEELNEIITQVAEKQRQENSTADADINPQVQIERLQQRVDIVNRIIMRIYEDMESGLLQTQSGQSMISRYQEEISSLLEKKDHLISEQVNEEAEPAEIESCPGCLDISISNEDLSQSLMNSIIERIEVGPRTASLIQRVESKDGSGYDQNVEIFYKFRA